MFGSLSDGGPESERVQGRMKELLSTLGKLSTLYQAARVNEKETNLKHAKLQAKLHESELQSKRQRCFCFGWYKYSKYSQPSPSPLSHYSRILALCHSFTQSPNHSHSSTTECSHSHHSPVLTVNSPLLNSPLHFSTHTANRPRTRTADRERAHVPHRWRGAGAWEGEGGRGAAATRGGPAQATKWSRR